MAKTFNVNHYIPTVVCVTDVEADSMEAAIEKSMGTAMGFAEKFFTIAESRVKGVKHSQCAEGHLGALVDLVGDEDYAQSTFFGSEEAKVFLPEELDGGE